VGVPQRDPALRWLVDCSANVGGDTDGSENSASPENGLVGETAARR